MAGSHLRETPPSFPLSVYQDFMICHRLSDHFLDFLYNLRISQGHDIRCDTRVLMGEQPTGATHAGLYLIEHEQPVVAIA